MDIKSFMKDNSIVNGYPKLIENVSNPIIIKSNSLEKGEASRVGLRFSPREVLYADLGLVEPGLSKAYGSEYLKNTHAEMVHKDNDKNVEKLVTTVGEIPVRSDGEEDLPGNVALTPSSSETRKPNPKSKVKKINDVKSMSASEAIDSLTKAEDEEDIDEQEEEIARNEPTTDYKSTSFDWIDDLSKGGTAGEGMRGGDIVGHTKVGKPIYSSSHNVYLQEEKAKEKFFEGYSKNDHKEASVYHTNSGEAGAGKASNFHSQHYHMKSEVDKILDICKATDWQKEKIGTVMQEHKDGELYSNEKRVKTKEQAIAIALNKVGISKKSFIDAINESDEQIAKRIKRGIHENSNVLRGKKRTAKYKSELDDLCDLVKSGVPAIKNDSNPENIVAKNIVFNNPFIKSVGPGGMYFNFPNSTGDRVVDNFNDILKGNMDVEQEKSAIALKKSYDKEYLAYVQKGEEKYMKERGIAESNDVFLSKNGNNDNLESIKETFHKSSAVVNGEKVIAMSETDAQVLEMSKSFLDNQEGTVIDPMHTSSNGVILDAMTGKAYDAITGDEVKSA